MAPGFGPLATNKYGTIWVSLNGHGGVVSLRQSTVEPASGARWRGFYYSPLSLYLLNISSMVFTAHHWRLLCCWLSFLYSYNPLESLLCFLRAKRTTLNLSFDSVHYENRSTVLWYDIENTEDIAICRINGTLMQGYQPSGMAML